MYQFWLGKMILPIPPESLEHNYRSNSKTLAMIEGGELFIRRDAGLLEYRFTILIPQTNIGINNILGRGLLSRMVNSASFYISTLEELKYSQEPVEFTVIRSLTSLRNLFSTKKICVVDSLVIRESSHLGLNVEIDITLKEYREIKTKRYQTGEIPIGLRPFLRPESPYISKTDGTSLINSGIRFLKREGERMMGKSLENGKKWIVQKASHLVQKSSTLSRIANRVGSYFKSEAGSNMVKAAAWGAIKLAVGAWCPILGVLL